MDIDRVLVTGAGGFIGSHLVDDQLSKGRGVTAFDINLDRLAHQASNSNCNLVSGDIRDTVLVESLVPGHQIVFHLASAHLEVNRPPSFFTETNVDAVRELARICQRHGVRRLVHCSSVGVFGSLQSLPADEETECRPTIEYEKSKLSGEKALRETAQELDYVVLRPVWVYGPRCPRTLKLFRAIKSGKFVKVGFKETYRHPVFIEDMLAAFDLAASAPGASRRTIIVGGDQAVTLDKLIAEVACAIGTNFRPVTVPLLVMTPLTWIVEKAWTLTGRQPPFSGRSLKFFTDSSAFDISKARELLGYYPKVDIVEGLTRTAKHLSDNELL